jgi:hypothetical protein
VRHYLRKVGRDEAEYRGELFALFARDNQGTVDHLRRWRDAGGTHTGVPSMNNRLGGDIDAHIEYVADVKRMLNGTQPRQLENR